MRGNGPPSLETAGKYQHGAPVQPLMVVIRHGI